jgi:hypothetical protein
MKTTYITPEISVIEIDREISLRMQTFSPTGEATEPGSGGAGLGGEGNGSGESGWERTSQHCQGINAITPSAQQQQNQMPQNENSWQNFEW